MEELDKSNGYKQLCWKCAKACNLNACIWVATLKIKPLGVELDKQGYIIKCPLFEKDNGIYNKQDLANKLGVTPQEYKQICYVVLEMLKKGINATINECINFMHKTGGTCKDYATIKRGLKRGNLEYIPLEYAYKQLQNYDNHNRMASFVNACNKEYQISKQETKAIELFKQQEEIKAQERKREKEIQKAEREKFVTSYLGKDSTQIKRNEPTNIYEYIQELNITKETISKIKCRIRYYKNKGIETTLGECLRFIYITNSDFEMFFFLKRELQKRGLNCLPEDYYIKTFVIKSVENKKEISRPEIKERPKRQSRRVIPEFCKEHGITEDIYIKIKYFIKDHRKKGIRTTHEECLNFMHTTGADYKDYFLVLRELKRKGVECSPVDYYNNNLEELKSLRRKPKRINLDKKKG